MANPTRPPMRQNDEDTSADELIRSVMIEQKRVKSREVLPELEPVEETREPAPRMARKAARTAPKGAYQPDARTGIVDRIKAYRPSRKHIFLVVLAGVVIWRPWLVPGILFVTFWIGLIVYLTLGPDRTMEKLSAVWTWLQRTRPETAEKLRDSADRFALKFDALLERLPDRWAERLALPDFSQPSDAQVKMDEATDPFDRLKPLPEVYRG